MSSATDPQAMARKTPPQVLADVQQLEQAGDFRQLYGYLTQLAKYGDQPRQYESLFSRYFTSPEAGLREAAVICLLVTLRIQNPQYQAQALAMLADKTLDFDARLWAGSGLAVAYKSTKAPRLLAAFLAVMDDDSNDKYLRSSCIQSIVLLLGVSSRQQWLRAQSDSLPALWEEFAGELAAARRIAQGR